MSRLVALACVAALSVLPGQARAQAGLPPFDCVFAPGGVCSILSDAPAVVLGVHMGGGDLMLLHSEGPAPDEALRDFLAGVEIRALASDDSIRVEPVISSGYLHLRVHNTSRFVMHLRIRTTSGASLREHLRDTLGSSAGELTAAVLAESAALPFDVAGSEPVPARERAR
jgi:hypothetical protein